MSAPASEIDRSLSILDKLAAEQLNRGQHAAHESSGQASNLPDESGTPSGFPPAPPPDTLGPLPDEAYADEISRIQAEPYQMPEWVQPPDTDPADDWPDPVDLWGTTPLPDLPAGCLPPAIEPYITDQAARAGVDVAQVALNCYVVCAALIRAGIGLQMQDDMGDGGRVWTEYPVLWGAVVGAHGEKKGVGLDVATHHFRAIDARTRMQEDSAWKAYENKVKIHEKRMQQYYSEAAKNPNAEMPELEDAPPKTRYWTDDTTLQGLAKTFPTNPRRKIALIFDELSGWFGSWDAFTNGKADIERPAYLSFYESKPRIIDRVGGGTWFLEPFGGIVLGGIQPDVFAKIAAKMPPDGMLQRLQIVISKPAVRVERRAADQAITAQWVKINENLAAMVPRANPVRLSKEAARYMDEQIRWIDQAQQSGIAPSISGWLAKWEGLWGRLAITAHCIADAARCNMTQEQLARGEFFPSPEVSLATMQQCWKWMREFLWPHALRFYGETLYRTDDKKHVLKFAEFVLARGITEVMPSNLSGKWTAYREFDTIQKRREFWDSVINIGIGRSAKDGLDRTGTIPRRIIINPKFHDGRFAERAEIAQRQLERHTAIMHPAFVAAQKREPGEDG